MKRHHYTEEEKAWLKANINAGTYTELTRLFNATFGADVNKYSISDVCSKRMKLQKESNSGRFDKGSPVRSKTYPIGTERKYNGYWMVKVDNKYHEGKTTTKMFCENWKPKQIHIYEQVHGTITNNSFVVFLDCNPENFDIKNLYCIDRRILSVMNNNHWFKSDPVLTLTAIKWCELHYAIKDVKNEQVPQ